MSEQLEVDGIEMTMLAEYQARHEALRRQSTRLLLMCLSDPTVSSIYQEVETWKELYEDIYGPSGMSRGSEAMVNQSRLLPPIHIEEARR